MSLTHTTRSRTSCTSASSTLPSWFRSCGPHQIACLRVSKSLDVMIPARSARTRDCIGALGRASLAAVECNCLQFVFSFSHLTLSHEYAHRLVGHGLVCHH